MKNQMMQVNNYHRPLISCNGFLNANEVAF